MPTMGGYTALWDAVSVILLITRGENECGPLSSSFSQTDPLMVKSRDIFIELSLTDSSDCHWEFD